MLINHTFLHCLDYYNFLIEPTRSLLSPIHVWSPFPPVSLALATDSMIGQQHTDTLDSSTFNIIHQSLFHLVWNQCDLFVLICI